MLHRFSRQKNHGQIKNQVIIKLYQHQLQIKDTVIANIMVFFQIIMQMTIIMDYLVIIIIIIARK